MLIVCKNNPKRNRIPIKGREGVDKGEKRKERRDEEERNSAGRAVRAGERIHTTSPGLPQVWLLQVNWSSH